jgi:uncharacterized protein YutE (UPF0331/DUF86 family)
MEPPVSQTAAAAAWSDRSPGIVPVLRTDIGAVLRPVDPDLVYVYGSAVTGLGWQGSDLDFGIAFTEPDPAARLRRQAWATRLLQAHFGSSKVECGDLNRTDSIHYLVHVIGQGLCLYARTAETQLVFEEAILRQAGEAPLARPQSWEAIKARYRQELATETGLVERDKLEKNLWQSIELLRFLAPYQAMPTAQFLSPVEFEHRFAVAHVLRQLMECVLTISRHLMLALGWARVYRPEDILQVVARHGVIPADLIDDLRLVLSIRDPLTYPDGPVDWMLVQDVLHHRLNVFVAFHRHVVLFLDRIGI